MRRVCSQQRSFHVPTLMRAAEQSDQELHEVRQVHARSGQKHESGQLLEQQQQVFFCIRLCNLC